MTATIHSPYLASPQALWLRGNLHTHTTRSDGALSPQEAVDAYAALGHDFLALSDHNLPSDYSGLELRGPLLVPANEVTGGNGHVLALGVETPLDRGRPQQETIDAINAAGGLAVLCHPNWGSSFDHYSYEALAAADGFMGVEIYNGSIEEDPGSPYALGKWDRLLAAGRRVWGLATDDAHRAAGQGRGLCVARARARSAGALLEALRAGSFYASTGVSIESIEVEGSRLRLRSPEAEAFAVIGEFGRRLARVEGRELVYDAAGSPGAYFRVECCGPAGRAAWTQPFGVSGNE